MSIPAALIILGVIVVLIVLIAFDQRSRRPKQATAPDSTMEQAWRHYVDRLESGSERDRRAIERLGAERDPPPPELARTLAATVERALAADQPLAVLREAIMDATDRFVMEETLFRPDQPPREGGEPSAGWKSVEAVLEAGSLRRFSMLRFGDFAQEDWYTHYLKVARMNAENVATMIEKTLGGSASSLETTLHQRLTGTMRQARAALLRYPPQRPVTRGDQLVAAPSTTAPIRRSPTQRQIDRLAELMGDRMERLMSGQLYQVDRDSPIPPAVAIQVEAALLHSILCDSFRQPTESWRRIMQRALGGSEDSLEGGELLETAQEVRRRSEADRAGGHFSAALRVACELAAARTPGGALRGAGDLAALMRDDATILAVAVRDIVDQEG